MILTSSEDMGCTVTSLLLELGFSGAVPFSENLGSGATNELFPEMSQEISTNNFKQMEQEPSELRKKERKYKLSTKTVMIAYSTNNHLSHKNM